MEGGVLFQGRWTTDGFAGGEGEGRIARSYSSPSACSPFSKPQEVIKAPSSPLIWWIDEEMFSIMLSSSLLCSIRQVLDRGFPMLLCAVASDSTLVYQKMTDGLVTPDPPSGPFQDKGRRQNRKRRQQRWGWTPQEVQEAGKDQLGASWIGFWSVQVPTTIRQRCAGDVAASPNPSSAAPGCRMWPVVPFQ